MALSLTFLGAAGTVTGSKFLVGYGSESFLVDCGLFQGLEDEERKNREPIPIPVSQISALILTHAHTDHAGGVPGLTRHGFAGPIFCSEPTRDFARLLLLDSARLQTEGEHPPLFDREDALDAFEQMEVYNYYQSFSPLPGVRANFLDAGHILGSAWLELEFEPLPDWEQQRPQVLVFSGDLGQGRNPLLASPDRLERADFLVLESTYGDRLHSSNDVGQQVAEAVHDIWKSGSSLLLPAFAIQRSQDLLLLFEELHQAGRIPPVPLYLDSPMACRALGIFEEYSDYLARPAAQRLKDRGKLFNYPRLHLCLSSSESRSIYHSPGPRAVISASGMCQGGRVLHHLRQVLPDQTSQLLFAGFQCPGTLGHEILAGASSIELDGRTWPVRAKIGNLDGLSGHADSAQIDDWLSDLSQPPRQTFLVHGDEAGLSGQQARLAGRGWQVEVPAHGSTWRLA